ncbi:MAG: hypothetical protein ABJE95_10090 [Byssovorax sp.]
MTDLQAELVFGGEGGGTWWRATFRLSQSELAGLQRELAAIDVFALKRGYCAAAEDGTQWFLRVQAARQRKTVVLDNHSPDAIARVADPVRRQIVAVHRDDLAAAAPMLAHDKLREPMSWAEDEPTAPPTPGRRSIPPEGARRGPRPDRSPGAGNVPPLPVILAHPGPATL